MAPAALALALCFTDIPVQKTDVQFFPMEPAVKMCWDESGRFRSELLVGRNCEKTDPGFWDEWLASSKVSSEAWFQLYCACHPHDVWFTSGDPRVHLRKLRAEIGLVDYYAGRMPPATCYAPRLWAPWIR